MFRKVCFFMMVIFGVATMTACGGGEDAVVDAENDEDVILNETILYNYLSGVYKPIDNECDDDDSNITITQDGNVLRFSGGFDYQTEVPNTYIGGFQNNNGYSTVFAFVGDAQGYNAKVTCYANVTGSGRFYGECDVMDEDRDWLVENCEFEYEKVRQ